jgi:hypothetical protein
MSQERQAPHRAGPDGNGALGGLRNSKWNSSRSPQNFQLIPPIESPSTAAQPRTAPPKAFPCAQQALGTSPLHRKVEARPQLCPCQIGPVGGFFIGFQI